jgi:predicted GNAT family acetyltransferase
MRGKGLAESLVRTALAWARVEKLKVVPQCSYVARFIERHSEYRDLL